MSARGDIRVGIGGWTYPPWRGTFYPDRLPRKDELAHAASMLTTLEINGTFYRTQSPATFAKWREAAPAGFVYSLKAPRYATNKKVLGEAGESIARFVGSGIAELGDALGPILWQFAETKKFDPGDFAAFLALLPAEAEGLPLRHALELRHESFCCPEAVALVRAHGAAIVWAQESRFVEIADATADFHYVRLMGTSDGPAAGYDDAALAAHAARLEALAEGRVPEGAPTHGAAAPGTARDVFAYVVAGHKVANPAAAQALIARLGGASG
ncbi:hypothetical protein OG2516_01656 [Oceanicola granulosus HTCC2516]|uniref:DUF72 domain-containing protein n=1 Tax=Oceanicola granulosus (strain ATCC BAA-861 / DSM 15982 / KCTC 12143 / HTCC2516) TaxID=314256 RepID=Q2CFV8_OCEGH|nr:DUF72 domain-containing protein [Oceanicola granulosus]EAR51584.1 hypothetical protein OG2516_01656 [Oceanicola granulosus HTCC2516]